MRWYRSSDWHPKLRLRAKKQESRFTYYRGTLAGFWCNGCTVLFYDDFMSSRTLKEDERLLKALENHVCKERVLA